MDRWSFLFYVFNDFLDDITRIINNILWLILFLSLLFCSWSFFLLLEIFILVFNVLCLQLYWHATFEFCYLSQMVVLITIHTAIYISCSESTNKGELNVEWLRVSGSSSCSNRCDAIVICGQWCLCDSHLRWDLQVCMRM